MWKTFQNDDQLYMIRIREGENLEIYLSDLINIWIQNISKESTLKHFQEANPLFDIKVDEVVAEVIDLVNNISDLSTEISNSNEALQLILKSQKSEFKIEFRFNFEKASSDAFLKEITVPLIQTVKHLEDQQKMLCNLIHRKDRELEEYKLEKGEISRDDLITDKFDESLVNKIDDRTMMNVFGSSKSFWNSFVEQHGDIAATFEELSEERSLESY
ncbi:uncharacterized protein BDFB_006774 [Asbolus verrucosus]|uniref:Non-homologous end-joining factor 1 n=1 Tax=Asbolus verrucosus TaxID=1661398 RepID=A0A482V9C7_ASBVE|nr:uncharacterized protein BDFB_006774 [Asbolus verrucosus]